MDLSGGVVVMTGVVDAGAFDHDKEALFTIPSRVAQRLECGFRHLVQSRVHIGLVTAVDLIRNVCSGEESKHGKLQIATTFQVVEGLAVINVVETILLGKLHDVLVVSSA